MGVPILAPGWGPCVEAGEARAPKRRKKGPAPNLPSPGSGLPAVSCGWDLKDSRSSPEDRGHELRLWPCSLCDKRNKGGPGQLLGSQTPF